MTAHLRFFFRQCAYALAFFSLIAVIAEYLVPGSVAPFLDPVPVSIIALVLLGFDAMLPFDQQT